MSCIDYYKRIFSTYMTRQQSHLTFWHEELRINENLNAEELGEYYIPFFAKADSPTIRPGEFMPTTAAKRGNW